MHSPHTYTRILSSSEFWHSSPTASRLSSVSLYSLLEFSLSSSPLLIPKEPSDLSINSDTMVQVKFDHYRLRRFDRFDSPQSSTHSIASSYSYSSSFLRRCAALCAIIPSPFLFLHWLTTLPPVLSLRPRRCVEGISLLGNYQFTVSALDSRLTCQSCLLISILHSRNF
jgi:hypothetical protein